METAGNTVSSSGTAVFTAGGLGSAWLAYEAAEFTPWQEILLDAVAWMIATVLCWDPMQGHPELEKDENEKKESHDRQHHHRRNAMTGRIGSRRFSGKHHKEDHHQGQRNQNDDPDKQN
jgi:hypothetical protein